MIYLDRNEWLFPYPKSVESVLNDGMYGVQSYARPEKIVELTKKTAALFEIDPTSLFFGHGSEDLILKLLLYFRAQTQQLIVTDLSWPSYSDMALPLGYEVISTPLLEEHSDVYQLDFEKLALILNRAPKSLVLLTTPNNPTGHTLDVNLLKEIVQNYPDHTFIIDGVYDAPLSLLQRTVRPYKNCIYLHSFSKFFGLPGARVGFGFNAHLASKFQMPLGIHTSSINLAIAALTEVNTFQCNRDEMLKFAKEIKLKFLNSTLKIATTEAPFIFVELSKILSFDILESIGRQVGIKPKIFLHGEKTILRISLGPTVTIGRKIETYLEAVASIK